MRRLRVLLGAICLLVSILATGCDTFVAPSTAITPKATASAPTAPPTASPEVDMAHARKAFEAGDILTYEEMVALKQDIVGDREDIEKLQGSKYEQASDAYWVREEDFASQLVKCTLVDAHGYILGWYDDLDDYQHLVPDKYRLGVYMSDPFDSKAKQPGVDADLFLGGLSADQVPTYDFAQPIRFSGKPSLSRDIWSIKNPTFTLLTNNLAGPIPAAEQIKDLHITLERSGCFGVCPYYVVDIEASGKVTFDGRFNTAITGTVTSSISQDKLIELASNLTRADFFNLKDNYSTFTTDVPEYFLTVQMNGVTKQVKTTSWDGPRRLSLLMNAVDWAVNSYQWVYNNK